MRIIGDNPAAENAEITAVASGALPSGQPVIVNADGTVSVVSETSTDITESLGSPSVFESASTGYISALYDEASQKVVVSYRDEGNSNYGTAVVGTVSGTSITFGSPVVFINENAAPITSVYDVASSKVVIAFGSSTGRAVVGTVSGTSISFGAAVQFESGGVELPSLAYDEASEKVVIAYRDDGNSEYGTAVVGTVSGTSISFGSPVVYNSGRTVGISATYDSASEVVVVFYTDNANSNYGTAKVGTVSGTSISFGSSAVFNSASSENPSSAYDGSAQKIIIAYTDGGNSNYGTAKVGTVSGTSISFGGASVFNSGSTTSISAEYNKAAEKTILSYRDSANSSYGTLVEGTVSGTSISFSSEVVFESASTFWVASAYSAAPSSVVIFYEDQSNSGFGTAVVFRSAYTEVTTTLTSENFIGFANGAAADAGKAKVDIGCAINGAQSGLTAGQTYYVQGDGTLGTTPASPSVVAGTAISSNSIIVKG